MSARTERQLKLLELIEQRPLRTQDDLAAALRSAGFDATQSSISRDVAALGLVKRQGAYVRAPSEEPPQVENVLEQHIREGLLAVRTAGDTLLVLRTPPSEANRVARAIDQLAWNGVVGTLAGDDTIFIAVDGVSAQRALATRLRTFARV